MTVILLTGAAGRIGTMLRPVSPSQAAPCGSWTPPLWPASNKQRGEEAGQGWGQIRFRPSAWSQARPS
jgi:hypothetical protein